VDVLHYMYGGLICLTLDVWWRLLWGISSICGWPL